jgi:hypothetical protein
VDATSFVKNQSFRKRGLYLRMAHLLNRIRPVVNRLDRSCHVDEWIAGCSCARECTSSAGAPAAWFLDLLLSSAVLARVGGCGP